MHKTRIIGRSTCIARSSKPRHNSHDATRRTSSEVSSNNRHRVRHVDRAPAWQLSNRARIIVFIYEPLQTARPLRQRAAVAYSRS